MANVEVVAIIHKDVGVFEVLRRSGIGGCGLEALQQIGNEFLNVHLTHYG